MTLVDPTLHLPCDCDLPARPPGAFEVLARDGNARAARLWTAHGPIDTPCFMPVGTYGAVKGLTPEDLHSVGAQIILGNAYHLGHRPGAELVRALGGLHALFLRGQFATLREWLRRNVHRHGRRHTPAELCRLVTGAPLSSAAFLAHLERKLLPIYGLA